MEMQRTENTQSYFEKENVEGLTLFDFKAYKIELPWSLS